MCEPFNARFARNNGAEIAAIADLVFAFLSFCIAADRVNIGKPNLF